MAPLIPVLLGAGVLAYLAFGKSSSAAAAPRAPSSAPSSYGGTTPSTPSAPAPSSTATPWNTSGVPGVQDVGTPGSLIPGQIDPATGSTYMGPGGSSDSSSNWDSGGSGYGGGGDLGGAASSTGTNGDGGFFSDLFSTAGTVGQSHLVWSQHPNVLAVTGGRGGWVPYYDGYLEGYAPPGGLPVH